MSLLGLVIVMAIGLFIYRSYFTANNGALTMGTSNPSAAADITGVKMDLTKMAQAERLFKGHNDRYGSLDELQASGDVAISRGRRGYTYAADVDNRGFTITAIYSGPAKGMPTLSIDEKMNITQR
jgi:hypothetical protein